MGDGRSFPNRFNAWTLAETLPQRPNNSKEAKLKRQVLQLFVNQKFLKTRKIIIYCS